MSTTDRFSRLRNVQAAAYARAPALQAIYAQAAMLPEKLHDMAALSRLPVTSKDTLLAAQRAAPPFGGFLASDDADIGHIFVSPGPIYEPALRSDTDGHGFARIFRGAGIGPGDRVLNTWAYHQVPAGLLLDAGVRAAGATVIPAGTGAAQTQAQIVIELGVTCICSSTAFFMTLVETLEKSGSSLPRDWKVHTALLGGEMGDWMAKRRQIEERYGITTISAYATGDFGLIGLERQDRQGYDIHEDRIVQICDPVTGAPLEAGVPGEIVVSTLVPGWPLIRFGTGDAARALALHPDGSVASIGLLEGRVGQAVKAREIFVYPRQLEELARLVPGIRQAQAVITRPATREEITLRLAVDAGTDHGALTALAAEQFQLQTRLRADHIEIMAPEALLDQALVLDRKSP